MEKIKRINTNIVPYVSRVAEVFFNTNSLFDGWREKLLKNIKVYLSRNRSWNIGKGCLPILNETEATIYISSLHWGKFCPNNSDVALCWGPEKENDEVQYNIHEICSLERRGSDVFGSNPWNTNYWMVKVCYDKDGCENPPVDFVESLSII